LFPHSVVAGETIEHYVACEFRKEARGGIFGWGTARPLPDFGDRVVENVGGEDSNGIINPRVLWYHKIGEIECDGNGITTTIRREL
jgi:hypothetical protein